MTRVLLTGGSGFLGAHVLDTLLRRGHTVVTTVRDQIKADKIRQKYPKYTSSQLSFAIVPDISSPGAFDDAVISTPPFQAVIHTASPYTFAVTDVRKQLLDPAINGTTGILQSIKKNAPSVTKVIITSSFAAIWNQAKGSWPEHTYSEDDWNPITEEEALASPYAGYGGSKKLAEKAAWDFMESEASPNFTLTTINPPMIYGPMIHDVESLDKVNQSSSRYRDAITGKWKDEIPATGLVIYVDVRDCALVHVLAVENDTVNGKRVFTVAGYYSNKEIAEIARKHFPEYSETLPSDQVKGGEFPGFDAIFKFDNKRVKELLGTDFRTLEETVVDTIKSLKDLGA